jgi:hypothetical protein
MSQKGQTRAQVMAQGSKNVAPKPDAAPKPAATPAAPSAPRGGGGTSAPKGSGGPTSAPKPATPAAPKPTDGAERRTPTSAELASAQQARKAAQEAGKSKAEAEKAAVQAGIERGTKMMGGPEGPGKVDTKSVESDLKKFKERTMNKEDYALVADYFLTLGHADSIAEAYYIVAQLDEETLIETLDEATKLGTEARRRAVELGRKRRSTKQYKQGLNRQTGRRERAYYDLSNRQGRRDADLETQKMTGDTGSHGRNYADRMDKRDPEKNPKHEGNK